MIAFSQQHATSHGTRVFSCTTEEAWTEIDLDVRGGSSHVISKLRIKFRTETGLSFAWTVKLENSAIVVEI